MMYFAVQYNVCEGGTASRGTHHPAHVAFRKALGPRILLSGPLFPADGAEPVGSLFVVSADTLAEAAELAASDPLCVHGVNEVSSIQPFRPMICNPPEAN